MNAAVMMGFGDLEHELASTRRILERVPMDRGDWKAHEKSFSVGATATHIVTLTHWMTTMLEQDEFDLADRGRRDAITTTDALLAEFDNGAAALIRKLNATDPAAMGQPWTLRMGDHVIMTMPRGGVLRTVGLSHMIHHRGQLSVYLRLLGIPVPGLYGPSADDAAG